MPAFLSAIKISAADVNVPFALTDATTIAVDASKSSYFRVTIAGNRTMGVPSNPTDGQMIMFEIKQDTTGSRTITWSPSTGGYEWGSTVTVPTLTTTASKTDYVGFIYNSTANVWRGIAYALGYT
jgi:hypothetical protein